jgi:ATP-binding cassette subfamily B protein|tara:strand:+ start:2874 stop:4622 length:1749 start_codon:yes stop_codon:yes gene_type:complete
MDNNSILGVLKNLSRYIEPRRKTQFFLLLILTIFSGLVEILSIASVVPFVSLITESNFVKEEFYLSDFILIKDRKEAIIFSGLVFSLLFLMNSLSRVCLIFVTTRLSQITAAELSIKTYKAKLFDSYSRHISKSSGSLVAAITAKVYQTAISISAAITLVSGVFIFICIISVLIWINPKIMIISSLFFGTLYLALVVFGKKAIAKSSQVINHQQNNIVEILQNSLGALRDIILDKTQYFYINIFKKSAFEKSKNQALLDFIQTSPRYIFEGMGILLFVILLIYSSGQQNEKTFSSILPTLAALAIAAQRILPLLNQLYSNYVIIKGNHHQVAEVVSALDENLINEEKEKLIVKKNIDLKNFISFKNVSFSYDKKNYVLENINFQIKKGSRIGVIGKTGEGKSTFLDLLMGLLEPDSGSILIDDIKLSQETNNSWQSKISHVPQQIFLSNSSFLENIAFGIDYKKIDKNRVEQVSKKSQIHEFIMKLENGYFQSVGERGIRLSGGQIQRIGLARALYKNTEVIIFDEATNSLDNITEQLIMKELYDLDKNLTIIMVAHRLNTLKDCDTILEIKDKQVKQIKID